MAETFGHVHGFETRPLELSDVMVPLHTISAISPKYGNRPTFAVWEYDKITFEFVGLSCLRINGCAFR